MDDIAQRDLSHPEFLVPSERRQIALGQPEVKALNRRYIAITVMIASKATKSEGFRV
jgi:hypothetical protein